MIASPGRCVSCRPSLASCARSRWLSVHRLVYSTRTLRLRSGLPARRGGRCSRIRCSRIRCSNMRCSKSCCSDMRCSNRRCSSSSDKGIRLLTHCMILRKGFGRRGILGRVSSCVRTLLLTLQSRVTFYQALLTSHHYFVMTYRFG